MTTAKEGPVRVRKWGHSLAVVLPDSIVKEMRLKAGVDVEIVASQPKPKGKHSSSSRGRKKT